MLSIVQAEVQQAAGLVREIFPEYLEWANGMVNREFGVSFDIDAMLKADIADLTKILPPSGRLLLAHSDGQLAGMVCLQQLNNEVGEIKRMYVRPAFRGQAIGRALLQRLLDEARQIRYSCVRLDSARFMTVAHALYRSAGFREIEAYPESQIPESFRANWIFMEKSL